MANVNLLAAVAVLLLYPLYRLFQVGKRSRDLPPGPPTVPILGNAHQIPTTGLGKQIAEWAGKYGPIFSLKVGWSNIIVLCDRKAINALLNKKGSIYSDRPYYYAPLYITRGDHLTLETAGPSWRMKRSIVTNFLNPKMLDEHHFRIQEAEAIILMNNILQDPKNLFDYAKQYTLSVAGTLFYGQRVQNFDPFWYQEFNQLMEEWLSAQEPGATPPVEVFPILKYLPGKWKTRVNHCRAHMDDMWDRARKIVDDRRAKGEKRDCLIDTKIDEFNEKGWPLNEHAFNNLFGELLEAGADTTSNQLLTLILAFAKYPDVMKRARDEIDAVCGTERAPRFSDFDKLPYVNAIVKEGMRWRPTAHTALPHMVTKDDWYEGMFIPKGSTIFIGVYAIHTDEKQYPDHERFNPDRFLNHTKLANDYAVGPDYENRDHYGYGAGRRICPGIHLAERNMWRITARLLWAFDFAEPLDPVTKEVVPLDENAYTSAILACPKPYEVRVTPRSEAHRATIEKEQAAALEFLAPWT